MAITAAAIGERVFVAQRAIDMHPDSAARSEYGIAVSMVRDLMHWANANDYDFHLIMEDAQQSYDHATLGPVERE